jgi:F-type H+-transporting ATPase subunit delta
MNDSKISVRYSRALFLSALGKNILDKVYSDMLMISEICLVPEFRELLENPVIRPSKKVEIIHKVIGDNIESITRSMIDMIVRNGRENYLPAIARVFLHKTKEHNGITETTLTTAVKVDEKIKTRISDLIAEKFNTKVELKEVIDKDIIGGFMLRIEDKYINASIKNKLRIIEKELLAKTLTD